MTELQVKEFTVIYGKKAGYISLEHISGKAQADFGDVEYYENGRLYNGKYLNISFLYL